MNPTPDQPSSSPSAASTGELAADTATQGGKAAPGARITLYVVGRSPNSQRASNNLAELTRLHPELFGAIDVEVVDALQSPERVFEDLILLTPALVVHSADGNVGRIIGDLSDPATLLATLASCGAPSSSPPLSPAASASPADGH